MTAREFYQKFISATKEDFVTTESQLRDYPEWVGKTYKEIYKCKEPVYTELVNKKIIHEIIKEAGLVPQHEYFRIDSIGYQHRYTEIDAHEAEEVGLNRHFWDLKVAVEHENDRADWMDEVTKLCHIRCPLKVIIGYNYYDQRDTGDIEKLEFIAKWMPELSAFDSDSYEEILIIIGNAAPKDKAYGTYEKFDYRGYLYDYENEAFERI